MRSLHRLVRLAAVLTSLCATTLTFASAATPYSKDGEATVYLEGRFDRPFILRYDAGLRLERANTSWSTLSIALLGGAPPSDAVTIGIYPADTGVRVFVGVSRGTTNTFRDTGVRCEDGCRLALRGNRDTLIATVDGREVGRWPRFAFHMPAPGVQLNGEVSALGDRIDGWLRPIDVRVDGTSIIPRCAFTTGGVAAQRIGRALRYEGTHVAGATSVYASLITGRTGERCADVR
jgi:hypothetical protein